MLETEVVRALICSVLSVPMFMLSGLVYLFHLGGRLLKLLPPEHNYELNRQVWLYVTGYLIFAGALGGIAYFLDSYVMVAFVAYMPIIAALFVLIGVVGAFSKSIKSALGTAIRRRKRR